MKIVLDVVAGPLGPAGLASAAGKLKSAPAIVESLASVGVKPRQIPLLASVEILSVRGLLASIWSRPLGVAAALGFVLYFLGGGLPAPPGQREAARAGRSQRPSYCRWRDGDSEAAPKKLGPCRLVLLVARDGPRGARTP
jgi:hypothetical protein